MNPWTHFFAIGAFLVGAVLGRVQAYATFEPVLQDLRRQVQAAEATLDELEGQAQPELERRLLERLFMNQTEGGTK